jgi:hypothetical protein
MAHKKAARWPYDPRVKRLLQTFLVMAKFEPATVRAILRTIEPRDVVARYDATVAALSRPKPPSGSKSGQLKRMRFDR